MFSNAGAELAFDVRDCVDGVLNAYADLFNTLTATVDYFSLNCLILLFDFIFPFLQNMGKHHHSDFCQSYFGRR